MIVFLNLIVRLIPAHAGKTAPPCLILGVFAAHPRSRGENMVMPPTVPQAHGSSPLTRGKPVREARGLPDRGLIPAHAGKTQPSHPQLQPAQAHPRSRGENIGCLVGAIVAMGSSPLTRGKQAADGRAKADCGLIPAHAGKTRTRTPIIVSVTAHPRSRGENAQGGKR